MAIRLPDSLSLDAWATTSSQVSRRLERLGQRLLEGDIDLDGFTREFYRTLEDAHAAAYAYGRWRGQGYVDEITTLDRALGRMAADEQAFYLRDYAVRLLSNPEYQNERYLSWRSGLYGQRLRGSVNEAFVGASPTGSRFYWTLTDAEHCRDCPWLAARSPYTEATLFTVPGAGDTECIVNCKCYLLRDDGVIGVL